MTRKKRIWLKVTVTHIYTFEDRAINGWDVSQVVDDWFRRYPIDTSHASRHAYRIGYSGKVQEVKQISEDEAIKYTKTPQEVKYLEKGGGII